MANCGITSGIGLDCAQKQDSAGGLKQTVYAGNISELVGLSYDGDGYVSSIGFDAYTGLHTFTSTKNGGSTISDIVNTEGGNAAYPQTVVLSLLDITPAQKTVLEDLANSETFWIVETSKGRFELFGYPLGVEIESAPKNSGNSPGDSTARVITLTGDQSELEKIIRIPDGVNDISTATRAALDSYVV